MQPSLAVTLQSADKHTVPTTQLHYESTAQADKEMDNIFNALAQGPHGANNGHLVDRHAPKTEQLRSMYWPLDVTVSLRVLHSGQRGYPLCMR